MANNQTASSPRWSTTTKIVVTLLILTAVIALLIRFAGLLSTLITAFIIAVLFHPIAEFINRKTKIPWTWSVSIIYLITVVLVFGLLTVGGIALINQINELIKFLQTTLLRLPGLLISCTTTLFMALLNSTSATSIGIRSAPTTEYCSAGAHENGESVWAVLQWCCGICGAHSSSL